MAIQPPAIRAEINALVPAIIALTVAFVASAVAYAVFTPFSVALTVPLAVVLTVFSAFLAVVFIVRFPCCLVFISEFTAVWDISVLSGAAETAGRLAVP